MLSTLQELANAVNIDIEELVKKKIIRIDELTKIELALDLPVGILAKIRFSRIKLNTQRQYEISLRKLKE